jgi:hypothetical protein
MDILPEVDGFGRCEHAGAIVIDQQENKMGLHRLCWTAWLVIAAFGFCGEAFAAAFLTAFQAPPNSTTRPGAATSPTPAQAPSQRSSAGQVGAAPPKVPPVEIHPPEINFGMLRPGAKVTGSALIQNVSAKPLRILASRASCTCTSVNLANRVLEPGESVPLEAAYTASSVMGRKKNAIRIRFEGYDDIDVPVIADVFLPLRPDPPYIDALPDEAGRPKLTGQFTVSSEDGRPFRILAVNGKPPEYVDFHPDRDEVRNRYTLKWDFSSYDQQTCVNAVGERVPKWVVIESDHAECPIFDLMVRHKCTRPEKPGPLATWLISEPHALLGAIKPGESREFEVVAKYLSHQSPADPITYVAADPGPFKAELLNVKSTAEEMVCRIRITPAPEHRGLILSNVRLYSQRQDAAVVIVATVRE